MPSTAGWTACCCAPVSRGYDAVLPGAVSQGISNVAGNLDVPGDVLNGLLQGRSAGCGKHAALCHQHHGRSGRLSIRPARWGGGQDTDFGEALHVLGASEGNYVEVPFLGPSTERDHVGSLVDVRSTRWAMCCPRGSLICHGCEAGLKYLVIGRAIPIRSILFIRQCRQLRADAPALSAKPPL